MSEKGATAHPTLGDRLRDAVLAVGMVGGMTGVGMMMHEEDVPSATAPADCKANREHPETMLPHVTSVMASATKKER